MQTEEFYKHIQQKINEPDFESEPMFLAWNQNQTWQRIEQKQGSNKPRFVWFRAAASIVLVGGICVYFNSPKLFQTPNSQAFNKKSTALSIQENTTKSTQTIANNQALNGNNERLEYNFVPNGELNRTPNVERILVETEFVPNNTNIRVEELKEITENQPQVLDYESITPKETFEGFVPIQRFIEKRTPQKRERIAILEIPEDDDSYGTSSKPKKRGLLARLSRKTEKLSIEPAEELPAIGGKPNKIWAFVKESFKNETMTTDSTEK